MTATETRPENDLANTGLLADHAESIRQSVHHYRADRDPEHIHQIRVSTRRARAALDRAPGDDATLKLKSGVKALAGSLGQTRDADVVAALIHEQVERHLPHLRSELEPLLAEIARDTEEFQEIALRRFRSPYLNVLLKELRNFEPDGDMEEMQPAEMSALLGKRWKKLRGTNRTRKQEASPENLHRMRVAAKKFRYTIEMHVDAERQRVRKLVKSVRKLQNLLDEIHDLHMASDRVRPIVETGQGEWSPESVTAGEQLLYILNYVADRKTGKVGKAYKKVKRKRKRMAEFTLESVAAT